MKHKPNIQRRITVYFFACALMIAGCEAEATPFPVDVPAEVEVTPTVIGVVEAADPVQTDVQPAASMRYGLAAYNLPVADLEQLQAAAQVEMLDDTINPADLGVRFDIMAAYGVYPGAQVSPTLAHVALMLNTQMPPLNDSAVVSIVQRALDTEVLVSNNPIPGLQAVPNATTDTRTLREELANAGWPDGFDVRLAETDSPAASPIVEQLLTIGMTATRVPLDALPDAHMALVMWATDDERGAWLRRAGDEAVLIDLFAIPISYWTIEGLNITFTPGGWPIASR